MATLKHRNRHSCPDPQFSIEIPGDPQKNRVVILAAPLACFAKGGEFNFLWAARVVNFIPSGWPGY